MASGQLLLEGQGGQVEAANSRLALADVRVVSVEAVLRRFCFARGNPHSHPFGGEFDFEADMAETGRSADRVQVKFSLSFGKEETGQHCELEGTANFHFTHLDPRFDLEFMGTELQNEMSIQLYRRYYDLVYLVHDTFGVEAPSPWIVQDVSLSSRVIQE